MLLLLLLLLLLHFFLSFFYRAIDEGVIFIVKNRTFKYCFGGNRHFDNFGFISYSHLAVFLEHLTTQP